MTKWELLYITDALDVKLNPEYPAQGMYKHAIRQAKELLCSYFVSHTMCQMTNLELLILSEDLTSLAQNFESGKAMNRASYTKGIRYAKQLLMKAYELRHELNEMGNGK